MRSTILVSLKEIFVENLDYSTVIDLEVMFCSNFSYILFKINWNVDNV